jgi:hypothetical protein
MIKLKSQRKLALNLKDTVQELNKNLGLLIGMIVGGMVLPRPFPKLMSKMPPVLLHKHGQPLHRPKIWIHHHLRQRTKLRSPIPSITTMDKHILAAHQIDGHFLGTRQYQEDILNPTRG